MNFKPFPGLTDILLSEQCETSCGYWHKHKFEGVVYSPNLAKVSGTPFHEPSIPPPTIKKLKVATVAMSLW